MLSGGTAGGGGGTTGTGTVKSLEGSRDAQRWDGGWGRWDDRDRDGLHSGGTAGGDGFLAPQIMFTGVGRVGT
eukprot:COSAG02_NODE_4069_length_5831_cov_3.564778_1_plen_73_part_00